MNTTFNLKRFFLLEKYKKQETGDLYSLYDV